MSDTEQNAWFNFNTVWNTLKCTELSYCNGKLGFKMEGKLEKHIFDAHLAPQYCKL